MAAEARIMSFPSFSQRICKPLKRVLNNLAGEAIEADAKTKGEGLA